MISNLINFSLYFFAEIKNTSSFHFHISREKVHFWREKPALHQKVKICLKSYCSICIWYHCPHYWTIIEYKFVFTYSWPTLNTHMLTWTYFLTGHNPFPHFKREACLFQYHLHHFKFTLEERSLPYIKR